MKSLAVILIIAHKVSLSENERASLSQCHKILNNYSIKLICPRGLNISAYREVVPSLQVEFIDPKWQSTYGMFSLLKVRGFLYKKFKNFKYILFYEVDAWVFKDDLNYWCGRNFDYIGAPWFEGHTLEDATKIIGAGNGGFSLRNTRSCLRMARRLAFLKGLRLFWFRSYLQFVIPFSSLTFFFRHSLKIIDPEKLNRLLLEKEILEDRYWCERIGTTFTDFKVADVQNSLAFSFELRPSLLFKMNNNKLPFGCHAWWKYESDFWKQYIRVNTSEL